MRQILRLVVAISMTIIANVATATPAAYYNPADGSIRLRNDRGFSLAVVILESPSGKFTGIPLAISGASSHDFSELPNSLYYFNLPPNSADSRTWGNVGAVVSGGGALNSLDLSGSYYTVFTGLPQPLDWIEIPEPASVFTGSLGIAAAIAVRRRPRNPVMMATER